MRLLNVRDYRLQDFPGTTPDYAILSHRWGDSEIIFQDLEYGTERARAKAAFTKIEGFCKAARDAGYQWGWVDSCCIDKRSSVELSEAINSMFEWYRRSSRCFVYLADVPPKSSDGVIEDTKNPMFTKDAFSTSDWFKRGWTLQELLAPRKKVFFARDWSLLGTMGIGNPHQEKWLVKKISVITGVFESVLNHDKSAHYYSAAERMFWASKRETTREEDTAYCLMGLFGVNMPILYGEGLKKAFKRLQIEILSVSPDETLFAWRANKEKSGLLADSPLHFLHSSAVHQRALRLHAFRPYSMTNLGIKIYTELVPTSTESSYHPITAALPQGTMIMPIGASIRTAVEGSKRHRLGIYVQQVLQTKGTRHRLFRRVLCNQFCVAPENGEFPKADIEEKIFVLEDEHYAEVQWFANANPGPRREDTLELSRVGTNNTDSG
jgi:hypothetical protein